MVPCKAYFDIVKKLLRVTDRDRRTDIIAVHAALSYVVRPKMLLLSESVSHSVHVVFGAGIA